MLIPSTITARRTRRYTSTWYIHPTTHKHDFKPMDGRGRYIFQPPQSQAVNPSRWSTLPPPFTYAEDSGLVFLGRSGQPLPNMAFVSLLRHVGIPAVAHGFRSSFKDWCVEQTDTPWVVREAALAHNLGNSTETAYARSDLFERRRGLMETWAQFLTTGTV